MDASAHGAAPSWTAKSGCPTSGERHGRMNGCIGSRRYALMDSQEWLSYFRGETWQDEWVHRLTALRPHGQPRVAVLLEALDHGQSSGFLTRPAATGFCSIYLVTRSYSAPFRIQWSNDSP